MTAFSKEKVADGTDGRFSNHDPKGIIFSNSYTLLGAFEVKTLTPVVDAAGVSQSKQKLLKMRNPFGFESYKGSWSDHDAAWDNVFFMERLRIG